MNVTVIANGIKVTAPGVIEVVEKMAELEMTPASAQSTGLQGYMERVKERTAMFPGRVAIETSNVLQFLSSCVEAGAITCLVFETTNPLTVD